MIADRSSAGGLGTPQPATVNRSFINIYTHHTAFITAFSGGGKVSLKSAGGNRGKFQATSYGHLGSGGFACLIGGWQPVVTGAVTRRLQQSAVGA